MVLSILFFPVPRVFVTIGKETPLTLGVEHTYVLMLDALVRFVDRYT